MNSSCIKNFAVIIVILILGVIIISRFFFPPVRNRIDKNKYPVTGIDISSHTGEFDFSKITEQKIYFIYLKATEGGDFIDPNFEQNYSKAKIHSMEQ